MEYVENVHFWPLSYNMDHEYGHIKGMGPEVWLSKPRHTALS